MGELASNHTLTQFILAYGYWAILFGVAVDSFGIPLPGEAMLLTASIYAGATRIPDPRMTPRYPPSGHGCSC
jgi:membrane protein DedA with SNARE-associated domain